MALNKRAFSVDLLGLNQKAPKTVNLPGTIDLLENAWVLKATTGAKQTMELRKRFGSSSLPIEQDRTIVTPQSPITSGLELAAFRGRLLLRSMTDLYQWSEAAALWTRQGTLTGQTAATLPSVTVSAFPEVGDTSSYTAPDIAVVGNITCVSFLDTGPFILPRYKVVDRTSGAILGGGSVGPSAQRPRVVACGGLFFLFYIDAANSHLKASVIDPSTGLVVNGIDYVATGTGAIFDVTVLNGSIFVAFFNGGTTTVFCVGQSGGGPLGGGYLFFRILSGHTGNVQLAWMANASGDGKLHLLIASSGDGVYWSVIDPNTGLVLSSTQISSATNAVEITGGVDVFGRALLLRSNAGDIMGEYSPFGLLISTVMLGVSLATRLFVGPDGKWYFGVSRASALQGANFLCSVDFSNPLSFVVARWFNGNGGLGPYRPSGVALIGSTAVLAAVRKTRSTSFGTMVTPINSVYRIELTFGAPGAAAQIGQSLYLNGGILWQFDGASLVESGFIVGPDTVTPTVIGAGSLSTGTYGYIGVYEWTDVNGNLHRSFPSVAAQVSVTAGQGVQINFQNLQQTVKTGVSLAAYRSVANGPGLQYYKITSDLVPALNSKGTGPYTTFFDTISDATLVGNQPLYTTGTTGGVLPSVAPPSARVSIVHQNRLFVADEDDRVWASNEFIPGIGVNFNAATTFVLPDDGGRLVGFASMDQTLVVFKTTGIFHMTGAFPGLTGAGSFPTIIRVDTPLGLSGPNATANIEAGVVFQDVSGRIWLLTRGSMQLQFIGAPVEDERAPILRTVVSRDPLQVRLYAAAGRTLVYDVVLQQWSVFTGQAAASACLWNGVPTYLDPGGVVHYEVPGQFHDSGEPICTRIGIAGIGTAGVGGLQRIWNVMLRGDRMGPHHLRLTTFLDGAAASSETFDAAWDALTGATVFGSSTPFGNEALFGGNWRGIWAPEFKLGKSRMSYLRLLIEDYFPEGVPSEGFRVQHIGLIGATKPGQDLAGARVSPS